MRKCLMKLASTAAILLAATLAADAATWTGSAGLKAVAENFMPIENAQSSRPGDKCQPGFVWHCRGGYCSCKQVR